jgi:hypothetical protein
LKLRSGLHITNAGKYWIIQGVDNRGTLVQFSIETKTSPQIVQTVADPKFSSDRMHTGSNFPFGETSISPMTSIWCRYQKCVELWLHPVIHPYVVMLKLTKRRIHVYLTTKFARHRATVGRLTTPPFISSSVFPACS